MNKYSKRLLRAMASSMLISAPVYGATISQTAPLSAIPAGHIIELTVTRTGNMEDPMLVELIPFDNPTAIDLPDEVLIGAGSASANFTVTGLEPTGFDSASFWMFASDGSAPPVHVQGITVSKPNISIDPSPVLVPNGGRVPVFFRRPPTESAASLTLLVDVSGGAPFTLPGAITFPAGESSVWEFLDGTSVGTGQFWVELGDNYNATAGAPTVDVEVYAAAAPRVQFISWVDVDEDGTINDGDTIYIGFSTEMNVGTVLTDNLQLFRRQPSGDYVLYPNTAWGAGTTINAMPDSGGRRFRIDLEGADVELGPHIAVKPSVDVLSDPGEVAAQDYMFFPDSEDWNQDGISDVWYIKQGLNPRGASVAQQDWDNDGLINLWEYRLDGDPNDAYSLDPVGALTDGEFDSSEDGMSNAEKIALGLDPDATDTDRDGISDVDEIAQGTDPANAYDPFEPRAVRLDGDTRMRVRSLSEGLLNNWTVEAWVHQENRGGDQIVVRQQEVLPTVLATGGQHVAFQLGLDAGIPYILYRVGATEVRVDAMEAIALDEWTHIAAVRDAEGSQLRLFVDGKRVDVKRPVPSQSVNPIRRFETVLGGGDLDDAGDVYNGFIGKLDAVRVWDYARTSLEIQDGRGILLPEFLLGQPDMNRSPVMLFNFDHQLADFAINSRYPTDWMTGWRNAAQFEPGAVDEEEAPWPPLNLDSDDDGVPDQEERMAQFSERRSEIPLNYNVLDFSAGAGAGRVLIDELIDNDETRHYALTNWTIEAWVRPGSLTADRHSLVQREMVGEGQPVTFELGLNKYQPYVRFNRDDSSNAEVVLTLAPSIPEDEWSHLAASYQNGVLSLYMNGGEERISTNILARPLADRAGKVYLGSDSFDGQMMEVRIWNRPRTLEQIEENYRNILLFAAGLLEASFDGGETYLARSTFDEEDGMMFDFTSPAIFTDPADSDNTRPYVAGSVRHPFSMMAWVNMEPDASGGTIVERISDDPSLAPDVDTPISHSLRVNEDGNVVVVWQVRVTTVIPIFEDETFTFPLEDNDGNFILDPDGEVIIVEETRPVLQRLNFSTRTVTRSLRSGIDIRDGQWHHIAVVGDADRIRIYVDGLLDVESLAYYFFQPAEGDNFEAYYETIPPQSSRLRIGDGPFGGLIDEVIVWNDAKTVDDIRLYSQFGLDPAQIRAGLQAIDPLPALAIDQNARRQRLVSYVTFDGELDLPFVTDWANRELSYRILPKPSGQEIVRPSRPPALTDRVRVYDLSMRGYFAAVDGGKHIENYIRRNDFAYAGLLMGDVSFTELELSDLLHLRTDTNEDGIPDSWYQLYGLNPGGTSVANQNWDGTGIPNIWQYRLGADPYDAYSLWRQAGGVGAPINDADWDSDEDGLSNWDEIYVWGTDPTNPDTSDNNISDGDAVNALISHGGRRVTSPTDSRSPYLPKSAILDGIAKTVPGQIEFGGSDRFDLDQWTIEAWVNLDADDQTGTLLSRQTTTGRTAFELGVENNMPYIRFETTGGTEHMAGGHVAIPADEWIHLAGVWDPDADSLALYVNGLAYSAQTVIERPARGNGRGTTQMGEGLTGNIDELRVWTVARRSEQIAEWFNKTISDDLVDVEPDEEEEDDLPPTALMQVNDNQTADELFSALLGAGVPEGVTINSVEYTGDPEAAGTYVDFPLMVPGEPRPQDGILLATGRAVDAAVPENTAPDTSTVFGTPGDADLEALTGITTFDAAALTIEFTIDDTIDGISFKFVFGSEEFPEFVGSAFNDAFAAFLNGENISFDENNQPITVNNNFFQLDNNPFSADDSAQVGKLPVTLPLEYDGLTPLLVTSRSLEPGTYTLKLVIADAGDPLFDSGVFLSDFLFETIGEDGTGIVQAPSEIERDSQLQLLAAYYTFDDGTADPPIPFLSNGAPRGAGAEDHTRPLDFRYAIRGLDFDDNSYARLLELLSDQRRDGIADWWARLYFGTSRVDPRLDVDGDGVSNLYEYWADTNPKAKDTDNNGILDSLEDTDGDGLPLGEEQRLGTHPGLSDTADNGLLDGDPTDPNPASSLAPLRDQVLQLGGTHNDYVQMPWQLRFALESFTIQAWVNLDEHPAVGESAMVLGRSVQADVFNYGLHLNHDGGLELFFTAGDDPTDTIRLMAPVQTQLPVEQWTHVAGSFDAESGRLSLFIDGDQVATTTTPKRPAINGVGPVWTRVGMGLAGMMDDVAIFDRALTEGDVQATIEGVAGQPISGLVAYYRFDDGTSAIGPAADGRHYGTSGHPDWWWGQVEDFAFSVQEIEADDGSVQIQFNRLYDRDWLNDWFNAATLIGDVAIATAPADAPLQLGARDTNQDGIPDWWYILFGADPAGASIADENWDGTGVSNFWQFRLGADPYNPHSLWEQAGSIGTQLNDAQFDSSGDGLSNIEKIQLGLNPAVLDTDDNGVWDIYELETGLDPLDDLSPFVLRYIENDGTGHIAVPAKVIGYDPDGMRFNLGRDVTDSPETDGWTIEAMVYLHEAPMGENIILIQRRAKPLGHVTFELGIRHEDRLPYARFESPSGISYEVIGAEQVQLEEWMVLGGRWSRNESIGLTPQWELSLFQNGTRVRQRVLNVYNAIGPQYGDLIIGQNLNGRLDEVRIFNRRLPDAWVEQNAFQTLLFGRDSVIMGGLVPDGGRFAVSMADEHVMDDDFTLQTWVRTENDGVIVERPAGTSEDDGSQLYNYRLTIEGGQAVATLSVRYRVAISDSGEEGEGDGTGSVLRDRWARHRLPATLINDGDWHHLALIHRNSEIFLLVDGRVRASRSIATGAGAEFHLREGEERAGGATGTFLNLATRAGGVLIGDGFEGAVIDEVSLFAEALDAAFVRDEYINVTPDLESRQMYFNFDFVDPNALTINDLENPTVEGELLEGARISLETGSNAPITVDNRDLLATIMAGYFHMNDGGDSVQDAIAPRDARAYTASAGQLVGGMTFIDVVVPRNLPPDGFDGFAGEPQNLYPIFFPLPSDSPYRLDSDGDGMPDVFEAYFGLEPNDIMPPERPDIGPWGDLSGNGLPNIYEYWAGTDPRFWSSRADDVSDADWDSDGDGLSNITEFQIGSHPGRPDTDNNGMLDGDEISPLVGGRISNPSFSMDPLDPWDPDPRRRPKSMRLGGVVNGIDTSRRQIPRPSFDRHRFNSDSWTLETWFRPGDDAQTGSLIEYIGQRWDVDGAGNPQANELVYYRLGVEGNRPFVEFQTAEVAQPHRRQLAQPIPAGAWTHLAASYNRQNHNLTLYVDGQIRSQIQVMGQPLSGGDTVARIPGRAYIGSSDLRGNLNDVRIWSHARRQVQIQRGMTSLVQLTEPGLISYFRFDDGRQGLLDDPTADGDGWNEGRGAEDFAHRLALPDLEMAWAYSLRGIIFEPIEPDAEGYLPPWADQGVDDANQDGLPDWWEDLYYSEIIDYYPTVRDSDGVITRSPPLQERIIASEDFHNALHTIGWSIDYTPLESVAGQRLWEAPDAAFYLKSFTLLDPPQHAELRIAVRDDREALDMFINGIPVDLNDPRIEPSPDTFTMTDEEINRGEQLYFPTAMIMPLLTEGHNVIAIRLVNRNGNQVGDNEYFDTQLLIDGQYFIRKSDDPRATSRDRRWWVWGLMGSLSEPPQDFAGREWNTVGYGNALLDDYDGDGLTNRDEFKLGLDPGAFDSTHQGDDGLFISDYDRIVSGTGLTAGEIIDRSGLPPGWVRLFDQDIDANVFSAFDDPDQDGWDNLSEYLAGTDPSDPNDVPRPRVHVKVDWVGPTPPVVRWHAWDRPEMDGFPVAGGTVEFDEAGIGAGVLRLDKDEAGNITGGYLRQGAAYFLFFADLDESGEWSEGEPAGFPDHMPVDIGWSDIHGVRVALTTDPVGYLRFFWEPAAGQNRHMIRLRLLSGSSWPIIFEREIVGRNYVHEYDLKDLGNANRYAAMPFELPNGTASLVGYEWQVHGVWQGNQVQRDWRQSLQAPQALSPAGVTRFARTEFRWNPPTSGLASRYRLQVTRDSDNLVVWDEVIAAPIPGPDGAVRYQLPVAMGMPPFDAGGFTWRVRAENPVASSSWSASRQFHVDTTSRLDGPYDISGSLWYMGRADISQANFIVQVFDNKAMAGRPVQQTSLSMPGNWRISGLRSGRYYLRAFMDVNGNGTYERWEPYGFLRDPDPYAASYSIRRVEVGPNSSQHRIIVRDVDTDNDGFSDAWEWQQFGNLHTAHAGYRDMYPQHSVESGYAVAGLLPNLSLDSLGAGMPDAMQIVLGYDPLDEDNTPESNRLFEINDFNQVWLQLELSEPHWSLNQPVRVQLQYATDIMLADWRDVPTSSVIVGPGAGPWVVNPGAIQLNGPVFYRLRWYPYYE